jgi:hypothetical protein
VCSGLLVVLVGALFGLGLGTMPGPTGRFHGRDELVPLMKTGGTRRERAVAHSRMCV